MDFAERSTKLPIENFDFQRERREKRHGDLLPDTIWAVFCGPLNCGKTNSLLALITHPNGLRFENVYLYSKSLDQPKYKFLEEILQPIDGMSFFSINEHEAVISPDNVLPNSLMLFDDVQCEKKQDSMRAFFCMGRHKNVDSFYLCQSYARLPKHLIRDNINLLVLFKQDDLNPKHVYNDHVNTDMTFSRFKDLCLKCWNDDKYGFIVIDKDRSLNEGRFRKGFDSFVINIS